jgi:hypothetical protein
MGSIALETATFTGLSASRAGISIPDERGIFRAKPKSHRLKTCT